MNKDLLPLEKDGISERQQTAVLWCSEAKAGSYSVFARHLHPQVPKGLLMV